MAVPGLPTLKADILVNYDLPLQKKEAVIDDIGDMGEEEAQDTLVVDDLYLIPMESALDEGGGLAPGAPAHFIVAEDARGQREAFRFEGMLPPERR